MLFLPFLVEICNFLADTKGHVSYYHQNHIGGLIVSLLTFSVVGHGFTVGSKTTVLVFAASLHAALTSKSEDRLD